jgi:uncharacterized protein (DUF58 family)
VTHFAAVILRLLALALPPAALGWWLRIYPRRPLVWLAAVPALATAALLLTFGTAAIAAIVALDAALGLLALADLCTLPRRKAFSIHRATGRIASLQKPHAVTLTLVHHSSRPRKVTLRDGLPHELRPEPQEFRTSLEGRSRAVLRCVLRPSRRGAFELHRASLLARSRLGLWQRLLDYPLATTIHVYPDLQQLDQYALLARTNRLSLLGVRRTRKIGQDHEFERLRDYTVDDNHKWIDWRATARRNKLTVRDYQATQSQQIVFLVDGGRLMTNESAGLTLLDHALNALLMLSYVALRQNDQVGLIHFADDIDCFVPPRGGMRQMNRLLHASFDRFPRLVETRYDHAFRYLNGHCRKRSLVVLITSIIDDVNAAEFDRYLSNLVGRHLPLAVLLRDHRLFDAVAPEQPDAQQLWRYAAAADIIAWRHQVLTDLHSKGVLSVDAFPEQMTAPLVNRYLEIKARHLL